MNFPNLKKYSWRHFLYIKIISQTAWPISYIFNLVFKYQDGQLVSLWIMMGGYGLLCFILWLVMKISSIKQDWLYYGIAVFTWTCVIDLIYALEVNGSISGFMIRYLVLGERYLNSSWGLAVGFFDAFGFYSMYFAMIFCIENRKNYKWIGLYWSGGLITNLMVEIYGALIAKSHATVTFATLLNIPYVVLPIAGLFRFLSMEDPYTWVTRNPLSKVKTIPMALALLMSMWINVSLGLGTLGTTLKCFTVVSNLVPIINYGEPTQFLRIQTLIYLFYILPIHVIALIYLFKLRKPKFLWDLAVLQAGVMFQAQFDLILSSLHFKTSEEFRSNPGDPWFWAVNIVIVLVPHLYILFLTSHWSSSPLPSTRLIEHNNEEDNH